MRIIGVRVRDGDEDVRLHSGGGLQAATPMGVVYDEITRFTFYSFLATDNSHATHADLVSFSMSPSDENPPQYPQRHDERPQYQRQHLSYRYA